MRLRVAVAVRNLMAVRTVWTGNALTLLGALSDSAGERIAKTKTWPDGPRTLAGRLRRAATFLRKTGIEVTFGREANQDRTRVITITRTPPDWVANPPSEPSTNGSQIPLAPEAADGLDTKKRIQSGKPVCRQCKATPDGSEQERVIIGEAVWLHAECKRFRREGDGWGRP